MVLPRKITLPTRVPDSVRAVEEVRPLLGTPTMNSCPTCSRTLSRATRASHEAGAAVLGPAGDGADDVGLGLDVAGLGETDGARGRALGVPVPVGVEPVPVFGRLPQPDNTAAPSTNPAVPVRKTRDDVRAAVTVSLFRAGEIGPGTCYGPRLSRSAGGNGIQLKCCDLQRSSSRSENRSAPVLPGRIASPGRPRQLCGSARAARDPVEHAQLGSAGMYRQVRRSLRWWVAETRGAPATARGLDHPTSTRVDFFPSKRSVGRAASTYLHQVTDQVMPGARRHLDINPDDVEISGRGVGGGAG